MKTLVAILFLPLLCFAVYYFSAEEILPIENAKAVSFVTTKKFEGLDCIKNGNDYIVTVYSDFSNFYTTNKDFIKGFNLYFDKNFNLDIYLKQLNAIVYKSCDVDSKEIYYGYTNIFNDFRFVDGKKINLQIAKDENAVIIGFPLILTGF